MKQIKPWKTFSFALLVVSVFHLFHTVLARASDVDFGDELKAISAAKAAGEVKAAPPKTDSDTATSPSVDFSSELKAISEQPPKSSSDNWTEDINNFRQGVASIKEQKRIDEVEGIRNKCTRFWNVPAAKTCHLARYPEPVFRLTMKFVDKECFRFTGEARDRCQRSYDERRAERGQKAEEREKELFRHQARQEQIQCRVERSYCESAKNDVARGVLPSAKYPSWSPSDQRAAALASESLDIEIAPNLDAAIALQKQQDRKEEIRIEAVRSAQEDKKRIKELAKEKNERATELMCRADIEEHGHSTLCKCAKYLPDGGAKMTGCTK